MLCPWMLPFRVEVYIVELEILPHEMQRIVLSRNLCALVVCG